MEITRNREHWLTEAVEHCRTLFTDLGEVPERVRVSVGFAGGNARRATTIGQCWASRTTADNVHQIFISPVLDEPVKILATLVHELCHAIDDCSSGHKGAFTKLARGVGLEGKLTATHAGEDLTTQLEAIAEALGEYPHALLKPGARGSDEPKKQTTRMLKLEAPCCGYVIRTTRKWIDEEGLPQCPHGLEFELRENLPS